MDQELSRPGPPSAAAPRRDQDVTARARLLLETEALDVARAYLAGQDRRTLDEQVLLTEIPAPPFGEDARGRAMAGLMERSGLLRVETDEVGNVLGWYGRPGPAPLVLAAHLDTVFPEGTDVRVRREGGRLMAPGIGDDGRGLAAILAVSRALEAARIRLGRPLLVVATVGEEAAGDLRGVRHLFRRDGGFRDAAAFVSVDGAGSRNIVNRAVGAVRWRVTVRGPGGHSWVDWGAPNPLHALADAAARAGRLRREDGITFSVGRLEGGTSVNAIPEKAVMELEVRGLDPGGLEEAAGAVEEAVHAAVEDVSGARRPGTPPLALEVERTGDRPAGRTDPDSALVRAAVAATRALGLRAELAASSTDANIPMSLGVPAVTVGGGGGAGGAHTLGEWYDNEGGVDGLVRALLTLLLVDWLEAETRSSA